MIELIDLFFSTKRPFRWFLPNGRSAGFYRVVVPLVSTEWSFRWNFVDFQFSNLLIFKNWGFYHGYFSILEKYRYIYGFQ